MRREWRWILAVSTLLALGAIGAKPYATLAAPYYTLAARWIARGHPWEVTDVSVVPSTSSPGSIVRLRGTVRERAEDSRPAMRLISKLQVAAVVEAPWSFGRCFFCGRCDLIGTVFGCWRSAFRFSYALRPRPLSASSSIRSPTVPRRWPVIPMR